MRLPAAKIEHKLGAIFMYTLFPAKMLQKTFTSEFDTNTQIGNIAFNFNFPSVAEDPFFEKAAFPISALCSSPFPKYRQMKV
jgi:hypothetical protein